MTSLRLITDKAAIGLSLLCTLHCLALPLTMVGLPSLVALGLDGETLHMWLVMAVVPTSGYALTMGCRHHRRYRLLLLGGSGVLCLILAITMLTGPGEQALSVFGSALVAYGHYQNYRLCRSAPATIATASQPESQTPVTPPS